MSGCTAAPSCCCASHPTVRKYGWWLLESIGDPRCYKTVLATMVGSRKELWAKGSRGGMTADGAVAATTMLRCWVAPLT
ncbi:hypothetical protein Pyn_36302 [Prunus yedoensis var. nudiflora]|uniref:Uncharacterized protein n=1 Tax=Prunus yedoensis var. nudiflora TaxID=2094558 RepID=A0A314UBF2_PRUYE|nr:hypothetical protein Pyn_36302 [Prunus yedoensis var. nudiflora]